MTYINQSRNFAQIEGGGGHKSFNRTDSGILKLVQLNRTGHQMLMAGIVKLLELIDLLKNCILTIHRFSLNPPNM